jgi:hypothetical protein
LPDIIFLSTFVGGGGVCPGDGHSGAVPPALFLRRCSSDAVQRSHMAAGEFQEMVPQLFGEKTVSLW